MQEVITTPMLASHTEQLSPDATDCEEQFGLSEDIDEDYIPSLEEILARADDEDEDEDFFNLDDIGREFGDDEVTTIGDLSELRNMASNDDDKNRTSEGTVVWPSCA